MPKEGGTYPGGAGSLRHRYVPQALSEPDRPVRAPGLQHAVANQIAHRIGRVHRPGVPRPTAAFTKSAPPSVRLQDWLKHLPNIGGYAAMAFSVGVDLVRKVEFRSASHAVEKEGDQGNFVRLG